MGEGQALKGRKPGAKRVEEPRLETGGWRTGRGDQEILVLNPGHAKERGRRMKVTG
jgi:hypothetical protein